MLILHYCIYFPGRYISQTISILETFFLRVFLAFPSSFLRQNLLSSLCLLLFGVLGSVGAFFFVLSFVPAILQKALKIFITDKQELVCSDK